MAENTETFTLTIKVHAAEGEERSDVWGWLLNYLRESTGISEVEEVECPDEPK